MLQRDSCWYVEHKKLQQKRSKHRVSSAELSLDFIAYLSAVGISALPNSSVEDVFGLQRSTG